jgi:outer membrane protein insertion porin family
MTGIVRYTLSHDKVSLGSQYFSDRNNDGVPECDPLVAGRYLCDSLGSWTSSIIGATLVHDTLDNRARPSRGHMVSLNGDFAGLGGNVKYARLRLNAAQYWPLGGGFIFSVQGEGGAIKGFGNHGDEAAGIDDVRITDRFYLGEPQMRGFDIRGVGPRMLRKYLDANGEVSTNRKDWTDDALGGKYYYLARGELEIPLGSGARELGLRPSVFVDVGSLWDLTAPIPQNCSTGGPNCTVNGAEQFFIEEYTGDTWKPRVAVGVGVNWNSPFGPFRIDFAKVLVKQDGDDTKAFTFNVGTQF